MDQQNDPNQRPRYTWPWFLLGAVVLGIILTSIWMTVLIRKTREQRDMYSWPQPPAQTNRPANTNARP
ncbi:MAG TPA: hypothetical protein VKV04_03450 [Verrucomicrobiae bacterium]|nr:hypothetical protein [Verrucomicrobiae bacterium]